MSIKRGLLCIPAICWTSLVFYLCLLPKSQIPKVTFLDKIYFDKIVHFGFYSIMFLFYLLALKPFRYHIAVSAMVCLFIGITVEFLQGYLPIHRSFDIWDIVANACGLISSIMFLKSKNWTFLGVQLDQ